MLSSEFSSNLLQNTNILHILTWINWHHLAEWLVSMKMRLKLYCFLEVSGTKWGCSHFLWTNPSCKDWALSHCAWRYSWCFVMTLLESKECFSKEEAYFFLPFFPFCFLLATYEPADPVYTELYVLVRRICGCVSTESDLKLV